MTIAPEFSRCVAVSRIGAAGIEREIDADAAECRALALRFGVPAVTSLHCHFLLGAPRRGEVTAEAMLRAEVTRICVVSLEPFETTVQERFTLRFVPRADTLHSVSHAGNLHLVPDPGDLHLVPDPGNADVLDPEAPDELAYTGDQIDLGEAAAEQLALGLDPYPRMPGVAAPDMPETASEAHPFAALAGRSRGGKSDAGDA